MLKQHSGFVSGFQRASDCALICGVFVASYFARDPLAHLAELAAMPLPPTLPLPPLRDLLIVLTVAVPIFIATLTVLGAYRRMRMSAFWEQARAVFCASGIAFIGCAAVFFILKIQLSRSFLGVFCASCAVGLLTQRYAVLSLLRYYRSRGKNFRNVLIVGTGNQAIQIYLDIVQQPELGVRVAGLVDLTNGTPRSGVPIIVESHSENGAPRTGRNGSKPRTVHAPVVATAETYEAKLKQYAIDEVIFTEVWRSVRVLEEMAAIAVDEGITVTLAIDQLGLQIFRADVSYFGSTPLVHYQASPGKPWSLFFKRSVDVVGSSALLVLLSPVFLLIAVATKIDSRGPVFFRQERVGLNGRRFTMLKFRSMVHDAEARLASLRDRNEMTGPVFKIQNDPRITKLGSFLRRTSMDELPQLINVLVGDMSLVGPRPPIPTEVSEYRRKYRRRLSMRPGITCIWQVSGRNNIREFEQWAELDLEYIDNWSISTDFKLLLQTIPAVFRGSGAR